MISDMLTSDEINKLKSMVKNLGIEQKSKPAELKPVEKSKLQSSSSILKRTEDSLTAKLSSKLIHFILSRSCKRR